MKFRLRRVLATFSLVALSGANSGLAAEPEPSADGAIAPALAIELPPFWMVESVEISASVNDGDEVTPQFRQRFVANVVPREELYLLPTGTDFIGPFFVLIPTVDTTQTRKLYGIATSTLKLGGWSTDLEMENTVDALGLPRSLWDGPVVIAGSAEADKVAGDILSAMEIAKTVEEGWARAAVNEEALRRLAAEEAEALKVANQQRLDALAARYEQERQLALEEAAALASANKKRLDALNKQYEQELAQIERSNRMRLDALQAAYDEEREGIAADAETRLALSEAKAETAANKELVAALAELTEERERAAEIAEQAVAAEVKTRTVRYDAILTALQSENTSQRNATFDLAIASGDEHLEATAIDVAMKSGDDGLQAKALAALVRKGPRIGITLLESKGSHVGNQFFEITSVDQDLKFVGKYLTPRGRDPKEPNGTGSVVRDRLSISGQFTENREGLPVRFNCAVNAEVDDKGVLMGTVSCAQEDWRTGVSGKVRLNL